MALACAGQVFSLKPVHLMAEHAALSGHQSTAGCSSVRALQDSNPLHKPDEFEVERCEVDQEYFTKRGQKVVLRDTRAVPLLKTLKAAEELLGHSRPIGLSVNRFPAHWAVQVVLGDCSIISYVIDVESGELDRLYIDDSVQKYAKNVDATAAAVYSDRLILGMASAQIMALHNSMRDKAKRPFISKTGVARVVDAPDQKAYSVSLNCTKSLMCVAYYSRAFIFQFERKSVHLTVAQQKQKKFHGSLAVDLCGQLILPQSRLILCEFSASAPTSLTVVYEHWLEVGTKKEALVCLGYYDASHMKVVLHQPFVVKLPFSRQIVGGQPQTTVAAITCACTHPQSSGVVVGCRDGTLVLLELDPHASSSASAAMRKQSPYEETTRRHIESRGYPCAMKWHPLGGVLAVAFSGGDVCLFDRALQLLEWTDHTGTNTPAIRLDIILGRTAKVQMFEWGPSRQQVMASGATESKSAASPQMTMQVHRPKKRATGTSEATVYSTDAHENSWALNRHPERQFDDTTLLVVCEQGPLMSFNINVHTARCSSGGQAEHHLSTLTIAHKWTELGRFDKTVHLLPCLSSKPRFSAAMALLRALLRAANVAQAKTLFRTCWRHCLDASHQSSVHLAALKQVYISFFYKLIGHRCIEDAFDVVLTIATRSTKRTSKPLSGKVEGDIANMLMCTYRTAVAYNKHNLARMVWATMERCGITGQPS